MAQEPQQQEQRPPGIPDTYKSVKQQDGSTDWYPPDVTPGEIKRDPTNEPVPPPDTPAPQKAAEKAWEWTWKPKVTQEEGSAFFASLIGVAAQEGERTKEKAIAEGDSGKASRAAFGQGVVDTVGRGISSMSSPGQIGLMVASAGSEGLAETAMGKYLTPLLKIPGMAASGWFGYEGLKQMTTEKQEGESDADALERRLLGASAFMGTTAAAAGGIHDIAGHMLVKMFGLDPELANKVADRVQKLHDIRSTRDTALSSIEADRDSKLNNLDTDTRTRVASLEHGLEEDLNRIREVSTANVNAIHTISQMAIDDSNGKISDLQRSQFHEGTQIISDTVRTIREMEGDRRSGLVGTINAPFREIGEKIKTTVSNETEVRGIIEKNAESHGVKKEEIPPAVYKAMTKSSEEFQDAAREDPSLITGEVSFNHMTRIRDDLWNAAQGAKDGAVKGALMASYEQVTALQESAADKAGQGQKYRDAKGEYLKFKRGLGSGLMRDWLAADDVREQDMQQKVSKLLVTDDATTRAIRTTLKAAGVDVSALDEYLNQSTAETAKQAKVKGEGDVAAKRATERQRGLEETAKSLKVENVKGIEGTKYESGEYEKAKKAIQDDAESRLEPPKREAEAKEKEVERHDLVPGHSTDELAGKNKEELFRLKMQELANSNRGIPVTAAVMVIYGVLHASLFPLAYGVARGGLPEMIKNPAFQDWVIEQAGIPPKTQQANKFRQAIAGMGPVLRKIQRSGVPQGAAIGAIPKRDDDQPPSRPQ